MATMFNGGWGNNNQPQNSAQQMYNKLPSGIQQRHANKWAQRIEAERSNRNQENLFSQRTDMMGIMNQRNNADRQGQNQPSWMMPGETFNMAQSRIAAANRAGTANSTSMGYDAARAQMQGSAPSNANPLPSQMNSPMANAPESSSMGNYSGSDPLSGAFNQSTDLAMGSSSNNNIVGQSPNNYSAGMDMNDFRLNQNYSGM